MKLGVVKQAVAVDALRRMVPDTLSDFVKCAVLTAAVQNDVSMPTNCQICNEIDALAETAKRAVREGAMDESRKKLSDILNK